jgi:AraC-like DNA-binding protein
MAALVNANTSLIENLAKSDLFARYERAFTEATGAPMAVRPLESWKLPFHGHRKENAFCALMAGKSQSCAGCLRLQEKLAQSAALEPSTMVCVHGLSEMATPIRLGAQTIGYLQTGQVATQEPSAAQVEKVGAQARALGFNGEVEKIKEAYRRTPIVPKKRLESIGQLLSTFADHLAVTSNQITVAQANRETPIMINAKKFIDEHHTEPLSLGLVAQAVHASVFHFCKLFKKAAGINFTEYVSRVRVEKAKNLLLNRNLRANEIAYQVGFQSLTNFNRVFKTLTGESPSGYRARLPKSA